MLVGADLKDVTILPILPRFWPRSRTPQHRANTRFLCSGFSFGQSWLCKTNSQDCQTSKGYWHSWQSQTDSQDCQWSDPDPDPIDHAPGTRCQAWIVMPIRSVIVLFARSLFAFGFLLAKPPPGPTAWPVRAGGSTRNFFYF